ncbi:hypothetical protein [Spongiactinospora sp. 9N601]|uniref:hypothetical protein n=1 Tax=Spongiactinospora sp. 9N601 TaxID=3375149 RepID=UPI0037AEC8AC
MRGPMFDFGAYRGRGDLEAERNEIISVDNSGWASKYVMRLRIPTLVGPGTFRDETVFGVDLDRADYPLAEPVTWLISEPIPWSPHFQRSSPICIGSEFWLARKGHVTLGELIIHVAMMLNWDEKGRGPGYVGWNEEAIKYHADHYHGRALNPDLVYPALPGWLYGDTPDPGPDFEIVDRRSIEW